MLLIKKKPVKVLCVQLVPIYCLTHLAVSKSPYGDVERKVTSYENITVDILKRFVLSNVALPPPALLLLLFLYLSVLLFRCHNSSTLFLSNHWNWLGWSFGWNECLMVKLGSQPNLLSWPSIRAFYIPIRPLLSSTALTSLHTRS